MLLGSERVKDIEALLAKGDNVVLLSNHQTEADPSCWSFALHENHERLERDMAQKEGDYLARIASGDLVPTVPPSSKLAPIVALCCMYEPTQRRPAEEIEAKYAPASAAD